MISDLGNDFPKELVLAELKAQYAGASPSQKLTLACALANYGEVDVGFLLSSIADAPNSECGNIVAALNHERGNALKELSELVNEADANADWKLKGRSAVVALHLGDATHAIDVHKDRPDPTQQTVFIHDVFPAWHGNS